MVPDTQNLHAICCSRSDTLDVTGLFTNSMSQELYATRRQ